MKKAIKIKSSMIRSMSGFGFSMVFVVFTDSADYYWARSRVLETLNQLRNTQFRDTLVDQFLQCIGLYPIGTLVELNSGEVGVVIQQNQVRRLQPRVLVLLAPDKSIERFPRTIDLLMQPEFGDGEPYRIVQALPPNAYGIDPNDFYLA